VVKYSVQRERLRRKRSDQNCRARINVVGLFLEETIVSTSRRPMHTLLVIIVTDNCFLVLRTEVHQSPELY